MTKNYKWERERLSRFCTWCEIVFRYDKEADFPFVEVDDGFCRMLGYEREELMESCHERIRYLIYPPDFQRIEQDVLQQLEEEGEYACSYRLRKKNGEQIWVWANGVVFENEQGEKLIHAMLIDITDKEEIRREKDIVRGFFPGGVARVLITTKNFYIMDADDTFMDFFGTNREEYIGSTGMFTMEEDLEEFRRYMVEQAEKEENISYCLRCKNHRGEIRWVRLLGNYYENTEDGKEYYCSVLEEKQDIMESDLEESDWTLVNVLGSQARKVYEMILVVSAEKDWFRGFFLNGQVFSEEFPMTSYEEFVETTRRYYVHPEEIARYKDSFGLSAMKEALGDDTQKEQGIFLRMRSKNSEYRYKSVRFSYYSEKREYIIVTSQDVEQSKKNEMMVEDANRKILAAALRDEKETLEMRRNFSMMLAREMMDPLRELNKAARLFEEDTPEAAKARSAVKYMNNVVKNIQQYEMLERGHVKLENKKFSLDEVLWRTFQTWDGRLFGTKIEFLYHINLKWQHYYGDEGRIAQMVNHIMGNCILAVEGQGVINVLGRDEESANGINRLILVFQDDGITVNEDFFGRNYAVEMEDDQSAWKVGEEYAETSFSLIVARKLVKMMGGTMQLKNLDNNRNGIEVILPLRRNEDAAVQEMSVEETDCSLQGYSLLVIKKDAGEKRLGPMLKVRGAQVDIAYSGKEGLELWTGYPDGAFNAIILDGNPVDMDFLEFTDMFRSQVRRSAATMPILVLADGVSQDVVVESMRFGINAILPSDPELERLVLVLKAVTEK